MSKYVEVVAADTACVWSTEQVEITPRWSTNCILDGVQTASSMEYKLHPRWSSNCIEDGISEIQQRLHESRSKPQLQLPLRLLAPPSPYTSTSSKAHPNRKYSEGEPQVFGN